VSTAEAEPRRGPALDRLVFFSDAVFAIAITLLALDIRLPEESAELSDADLLHQLLELGPQYFSFVISFVAIGFYWIAHHRTLQLVVRGDPGLLLLNLLLLMGVAFIPFPTAVIGAYDNRTANIFYALVLTVVGLLSAAIWLYASVGGRLIARELDRRSFRTSVARTLLAPAGFALSAVVAIWAPSVARTLWYLIAAGELVIVVLDSRGRTWPPA
jgi:uncharacterized membrane protein